MEKRKNFMIQFCETLQRYPSIWNTHSYSVGSFSRNREERSKAISAIARELNITDIAVKNRYESVRRQLRDILQRQKKATCNGHLPDDIKYDKWYLYKYIIFLKDSLSKRRKFAYKDRSTACKKIGVKTFGIAPQPIKEEITNKETMKSASEPLEIHYEEEYVETETLSPIEQNSIYRSPGCSSSLRSSSSPPQPVNTVTSPLMSPMEGNLIPERNIHLSERLNLTDDKREIGDESTCATPTSLKDLALRLHTDKETSTNHFFGNYVNGMLDKLPENVANVTMVEISAILSNALVESGLCE